MEAGTSGQAIERHVGRLIEAQPLNDFLLGHGIVSLRYSPG